MIAEEKFVEHAKFGGNRYGTSKKTISDLTASGRVVVLDIEMEVCSVLFLPMLLLYTIHESNSWTWANANGVLVIGRQANQIIHHRSPLRLHLTTVHGDPGVAPPRPGNGEGGQYPETTSAGAE